MLKRSPAVAAALALSLMFSACGTDDAETEGTTVSDATDQSADTETDETDQTDEVAEDAAGEDAAIDLAAREAAIAEVAEVLPEQAPEQMIVMSVALAEILDGLGIVPAGVVSSQSPLPESMAQVEQVGSVIAPDVEKIISLQPDLVLGPVSIKDSPAAGRSTSGDRDDRVAAITSRLRGLGI